MTMLIGGTSTILMLGGRRVQSGGTMKRTRVTAKMTTMKREMRKKRRGRETAPECESMFTSNNTEVGVSELKAAGYDKLLASRVEGRVLSHIVEVIMNRLQVYHLAPSVDGVDRDVCITELVLIFRERGEIRPVDKKIGPKKYRAGCAPTKEKIKDNNNNDDDNNKAMDDADPDSEAPRRTAWYMVWYNGVPGVWDPDYREQYVLKDAEWRFDAVPQIMDRMNVSDYVDPDIELKLR